MGFNTCCTLGQWSPALLSVKPSPQCSLGLQVPLEMSHTRIAQCRVWICSSAVPFMGASKSQGCLQGQGSIPHGVRAPAMPALWLCVHAQEGGKKARMQAGMQGCRQG